MSTLASINDAALRKVLGNRCLERVALAINAGGAATIKSTNAAVYSIDGVLYTKAALAAQSFAITHDAFGQPVATGLPAYTQPNTKTVFYVVSLNSAGAVAVSQGTYAGQELNFPNDLSKKMVGAGDIPLEPDGYVAIGVIKIALANNATFTPATTALDATGVTATYYNVSVLPASL